MNINNALEKFEELRKSFKWHGRELKSGRNYQLKGKTIISVYSSGTDQPGAIEVAFEVDHIASISNRSGNEIRAWIKSLQYNIGAYAKPKTALQYPRLSLSNNTQVENAINEIKEFLSPPAPTSQATDAPLNTPLNASNFVDERILAEIQTRRGQAQFRENLLKAYKGQCAITGCAAVAALEAAHIFPFSENHSYKTSHGILLRADIHTLFDLKLISVNPENLAVVLAPELLVSYKELQGNKITTPNNQNDSPDSELLLTHYCSWQSIHGS